MSASHNTSLILALKNRWDIIHYADFLLSVTIVWLRVALMIAQ